MKRKLLTFALVIVFAVGCWSLLYEPSRLVIRREKFSWKLESLKVAFFADLHAGSPFVDLQYVEEMVQLINDQNPDLVLMGGDFTAHVLGGSPLPFEEVARRLGKIKNKYGLFSVLGNHDWWDGGDLIQKNLEKNKIRIIENESMTIQFGMRSQFNLVALGDEMTDHANALKAFAGVQKRLPKLLLLHDPGALLDLGSDESFELALAGHMHGGQVRLPLIGPLITPGRAPKEWASGWTHTPLGGIFVTNGIGTSILPVRLNAPPEIVIIEFEQTN